MKERMKMYNRNFSLAEKFIVENLNLNAYEAKEFNAVEIIADNEDDLIKQINGMNVSVSSGEKTIITGNAEIVYYEASIRTKFMSVLSNPLIASLLLMIGIYALIFGFSNPGMGAEILGALCILLGLIGLGFPADLAGIALLILGIVLIIYELSTHSFGIIGGAGVVALIMGIIFLGPLSSPNFYVSQDFFNQLFFNQLLFSILVPSVIFAVFLIFAVTKIFNAGKKKPVIGESMLGETAESTEDFENNTGFVMYKGELWKAKSLKTDEKILKGDKVRITGKDEYIMNVEKI
ncbi:MAG: hypothetical protein CVT89_00885 [Candidatus Altiarchaeales archaeon HGW-Altiarchaeales-2]|nr:MAG: hypothetical protein CVT89_00885 [Candidatus Altiarchaeales archaeon HGW-Altiarchaeales-2]